MVEKNFKHTEIGLVPEDWEVKVFTDLFTFLPTASYSRSDMDNHSYTGYIHYGDIHTKIGYHLDTDKFVSGYVSDDKLKSYSYLRQGDLIMADASEDYSGVGKGFEVINVPDLPVISGLHTFLLREKGKKFAIGFKGYFHSNPIIKKQYDALATGLKVYSLSKSVFNKIYIPIPPLSEQQAIAETLTRTDEWIESLEKLIAKKRLIKQGAMQKLLTPTKDWEVKKLGDIVESTQLGGNYQNSVLPNDFPLMKMGNIQRGFISLNKIEYIFNSTPNTKDILKENDFLFNTRNTLDLVGKVAIWRNELPKAYFNSNLMRLKFKNDFISSNVFMNAIFNTKRIIQKLKDIATGTTSVAAIYTRDLMEIEISFPSLSEQTRVASILSDMDSEIDALEQKLAKAKQMKQGMMQELLTGRIRLIEKIKAEKPKANKGHNEHINDAVLIGTMAACFGSAQFPMTRFKYTKVSYLLKRYKEELTTGYLKKAAGPYKPQTRYGGAEKIALQNKYVVSQQSTYKGKTYEGFISGENINEAIAYFNEWYGEDTLQWISKFKFEKNDNLELWATVDMAIQDLKKENKLVNVANVKQFIKENKEWKDKLKRPAFSDDNIHNAIIKMDTLFS